ncbi:MAG TPA: APC family permease [Caldisericia bacterium]|nr:APC family permease [Caldisericia bacterium]HPF49657.1 APC family permease [Caldisericia bacterium]HPI84640.1 APC family permease [Caldisericia bacterium]HPQ93686.1 APC family permease [Caldisericia bacterium]HRV74751.1 APC family permease [Caldisericia bacterium]
MHRKRNKSLGLLELVAIALGGMVGGGIFTVLGVSVSLVGNLTPVAIAIGGAIAILAAYSYVKLGEFYRDEGATFSFFKRTYPRSHFASSAIGWVVIFGYISTLALYAYTFSSYAISGFAFANDIWIRKLVAVGIILLFTLVNVWSVRGMGKIEDLMVYTKLIILVIISVILIHFGAPNLSNFMQGLAEDAGQISFISVLIVSSLTFVAYEGFQLVINAVKEMRNPDKNIARAIYLSITLAIVIYVLISVGAALAIPAKDIIMNKEYALAAGAGAVIGKIGSNLVILGAILATSSAISGTLFGSSRQVSVVSENGYLPAKLSNRKNGIPQNAVITMACISSLLILVGGLELILEFGSITFLLVSFLMALANYKIRVQTKSSTILTLLAMGILLMSSVLILYYEFCNQTYQMFSIVALYAILTVGAYLFARKKEFQIKNNTRPQQ